MGKILATQVKEVRPPGAVHGRKHGLLGGHTDKLPRVHICDCPERLWYQLPQCFDFVGSRNQNNDGNVGAEEVLLELDVLIYRDEHIELLGRGPKKLAVGDPRPAHLLNRGHLVID